VALNSNSRMKLKELIKSCKTTQMRAIYTLKKLQERGMIRRFTALTQNPEKRVFLAYGISITPSEEHKRLFIKFAKELAKENFHEEANDYCLDASTNGTYDSFFICALKSGEEIDKRGSGLLQKFWFEEKPRIRQALLSGVLLGKWPFHLENYKNYLKVIETEDYSL
jgi:DNA-binding Lrp family transcriptional regulator